MFIVLHIPMTKGNQFRVANTDISRYKELYPNIDVMQSLRNMVGWLEADSKKLSATERGVRKRIAFWLSKDQEKYTTFTLGKYEKHPRNSECLADRVARLSREADELERLAEIADAQQENHSPSME